MLVAALALLLSGASLLFRFLDVDGPRRPGPSSTDRGALRGAGAIEVLERRLTELEADHPDEAGPAGRTGTVPVTPEGSVQLQELTRRVETLEAALERLRVNEEPEAAPAGPEELTREEIAARLKEIEKSSDPLVRPERIRLQRELLAMDPNSPDGPKLLRRLTSDYVQLQKWEATLAALDQFSSAAAGLDPWERTNMRATAYMNLGQYENAKASLAEIIGSAQAVDYVRATAEFSLAQVLQRSGEKEAAIEAYRGLASRYAQSTNPVLKGVADGAQSQLRSLGE